MLLASYMHFREDEPAKAVAAMSWELTATPLGPEAGQKPARRLHGCRIQHPANNHSHYTPIVALTMPQCYIRGPAYLCEEHMLNRGRLAYAALRFPRTRTLR